MAIFPGSTKESGMLTRIPETRLPVDQFQSDLRSICGSFQVLPVAGQSTLRGGIGTEARCGFQFAHVAKNLQSIRRTKRNVVQDDAEHFFLILQEEGRALMSQRDTVSLLRPGDLILIDSTEPSEFTFFGDYSRQLSVHLPRAELHQRFSDVLRGGLFLPRTDHTAHAICAVLAKAFEPNSNQSQSNYLGEAMYGLLGAMLHAGGEGTDSRYIDADVGSAQLLERALNYFETKFYDSDLSIKRMATDLNVSTRQLQRAFLSMNTTPTDYLVQKRLALACQSLKHRQTAMCKPLISTIAYNCGFNDLSYFNRLFRSTFGCTPTQYANSTDVEDT
ncbi:MAG: hypothetical protein A2Z93_02270 [Curvibacter sp. GWA2_64_110]|nr:MAG: hypothetical protein A2Z93_02270 [Curvibacter sp. GWA2_64_110]